MSNAFQNELKKEFQLERMILFSDAVFAIAITLLALEIKVPEVAKDLVSDHLLAEKLAELIPKFVGFIVSFLVIAIYWVVHHRTFGYVINYNPRLLWLNLFFLLAVILMPFSSGFYSVYLLTPAARLPVIIYVINIVFLGTMSLIIWEYIANPKHRLSEGITQEMKKYFRFRAVVPPVAFILTATIYLFVKKEIAVWMPLLIPVFMRIIKKFFLKPQSKTK
ncbi:MAG TPA: TMEM175 family protein [Flavisolibacter sp.]|nr:TMEM175 family protein [Flavisolibacter sp.]